MSNIEIELLKTVKEICAGLFSVFGFYPVIRSRQIKLSDITDSSVKRYAARM